MTGRADLHFHLLPGVDDGPATMEETVEMALAAERDGTGIVVATPHVRLDHVTDVGELPERVREVRERLALEGIGIDVRCGGELGHEMVGRLRQNELEMIALGPPAARWLLLEAPFEAPVEELHAAAEELRDRGYGVVLAHPERSRGLTADDFSGLVVELERGALLQVNAWSLAGGYGAAAELAAGRLVSRGLATVIASDAHPGWRGPALGTALARAELWGLTAQRAQMTISWGPLRLLARGIAAQPVTYAA